jgi:hypothetical protein
MSWFGCRHEWTDPHYHIVKPNPDRITSLKGYDEESFQRLFLGMTIITQTCKKCNVLKHSTLTGAIAQHP